MKTAIFILTSIGVLYVTPIYSTPLPPCENMECHENIQTIHIEHHSTKTVESVKWVDQEVRYKGVSYDSFNSKKTNKV